MATSIFGIGLSGLNAAQSGLLVTGHNITNAATAGFHRQQAVQGTQTPQEYGAGFFGKGVTIDTVRRAYSQFLDNAVLQPHCAAVTREGRIGMIGRVKSDIHAFLEGREFTDATKL